MCLKLWGLTLKPSRICTGIKMLKLCFHCENITEDPCVPWRLPEEALSTRTEDKISQGWKITYQCLGQYGIGTFPALSYYYQDKSAPFTCTSGSAFIPSKSFSCQSNQCFTIFPLQSCAKLIVVRLYFV